MGDYMKEKYYDTWEFRKAIEQINTNPIESKINFEKYLKEYPKDYSIHLFYASCLMTLGDFEKAENIIKYVEETTSNDKQFNTQKNKVEHLNDNIAYSKMRLYCLTERYEELEKICSKYKAQIQKLNLISVLFYTQIKNKTLLKTRNEINTYCFRQMVEYSEDDFKDHIKKHLADFNKDLDEPNTSIFSPNFPIEDVLVEIKKYIPSDSKLYSGFYENKYVFKYDECGRDNNKLVNYFVAISYNNTGNLITLYPSSECEQLPCIDLNYMKKEKDEPKVKIPSQIEKFNKRFKRK